MYPIRNMLMNTLSVLLFVSFSTAKAITLDLEAYPVELGGVKNLKFHDQSLCKVIADNTLTTMTIIDELTSPHPQIFLFDSDCKLIASDQQPSRDVLADVYNFAAGNLQHPLRVHYDSSSFFINYSGQDWSMDWYPTLVTQGFSIKVSGPGWSMKTFPFPGRLSSTVLDSIAASRLNTSIHANSQEVEGEHTFAKRHEYWGLGLNSPLCRQIDIIGMCTFAIVGSDKLVGLETYVFTSWCDPIGFEPFVSKEDLASTYYEYLMYPDVIKYAVGIHMSETGWLDPRQMYIDFRGHRYDLFWNLDFLKSGHSSSYNVDGWRFYNFPFACNY